MIILVVLAGILAINVLAVVLACIAANHRVDQVIAYRDTLDTPRGPEEGVCIKATTPDQAIDLLVRLRV